MLKVKLVGHDFRYEVFQIVSLFYNKAEIDFSETEELPMLISSFEVLNHSVYCEIINSSGDPIFFSEKLHANDKKEIKNAIKRTILMSLSSLTNITLPWGILVGIRPTKIVHELNAAGYKESEIIDKLESYYRVSNSKTKLTLEVARNEAKFIQKSGRDIGFYIGIPFCPTRCSYCSFTSNPMNGKYSLVKEYVEALCIETEQMLSFLISNGFHIKTLYFGGGTPTALSALELGTIFNSVQKYINFKELQEFTVEAGRADSITDGKLELIKQAGCTRISINPQSMNDETLKRIGRHHTVEDVVQKFYKAREYGFDNINMDLIVGLPGEGLKEISTTMNYLKKLSPENITVHTMAIKRASRLNEADYKNTNGDIDAMYNTLINEIRVMELYPYYMYRQKNMVSPLENIGYCKPGKEGIYNIHMIAENVSIAAMGADGVTKTIFHKENRIEREANLKDVKEYITRIDELIDKKKRLFQQLIDQEPELR